MDGETPRIDVRAVQVEDALALHKLDYSFETDRIYTLRVYGQLLLPCPVQAFDSSDRC